MNWHVEIMAGKLTAVRAGRIRRLMICVPPRYLKSHLASISFPAWCLGHDPSTQIICASYAQTAMIENGFVYLPKEAAWRAEYLHELTVFPKGKHDDQVDSTAQMLDWFKRAGQEPQDWMWQQYKQALARGPARPEPLSVMAKRLGILRPL